MGSLDKLVFSLFQTAKSNVFELFCKNHKIDMWDFRLKNSFLTAQDICHCCHLRILHVSFSLL